MRLHAQQKIYYGHHTPWFGCVKLSNHGIYTIYDDSRWLEPADMPPGISRKIGTFRTS